MIKKSGPLFACVALIAGVGFAQAQPKTEEIEAARAQACVPPPCEKPTDYPPCEKPEVQHRLPGAELISIAVADGGEVRPLGGAAPARPELSVCARLGDDSFQLYLPSIDEPILRLGMLAVLNSAMQARACRHYLWPAEWGPAQDRGRRLRRAGRVRRRAGDLRLW